MLIYEYKLDATKAQYQAIDEAIRIVQFIRNKCLRLWMDERGISSHDLQCYCAQLAKEFPFATRLNSQARQASADRAWFAIQRFYDNCKAHKPGKKGYPRFQHDNRSIEYKTTGWKLEPDGNHLTFTDGCGIEEFPVFQAGKCQIVTKRGNIWDWRLCRLMHLRTLLLQAIPLPCVSCLSHKRMSGCNMWHEK